VDFSPHTDQDERAMLEAIGVDGIESLFEPIPGSVRLRDPLGVPPALTEPELVAELGALASLNTAQGLVCFAGGGVYDHYIPAAVRSLAARAEFATSYTPYQAELSQGILQALFEFQSLVCEIYGMDVANASLYDGANSVVEAVNLAVRATGRGRVLVASTLHPHYTDVLRTYTTGLGLDIDTIPFTGEGTVDWSRVDATDAAAVVVAYPNVFGRLEDARAACDAAHAHDALAVVAADPTAMGILKSPGEMGADIAVGEGQALGNAMFYGGPYVGLFATRERLVRQVPGRISGETVDADGRRAYVLTLQAREQHIRRAKATSNVCTNQTLLAVAAGVHLAWLGPVGLATLGEACASRTAFAAARLAEIPGCRLKFPGPRFKELVLETPADGRRLARRLAGRGWLTGPGLGDWYPQLDRCMLVAVTERRTEDDIVRFAEAIEKELTEP
jgi:glycine dehydrogenase subunit 1